MKKTILSILIYFLFLSTSGFTQSVDFAVSEPHNSYVQWTNIITTNKSKNIYAAAKYHIDYYDYGTFIVKYDKNGNKLWEKNYSGSGSVNSLCTDSSGNLYAVIMIGKIIIDGVEYATNTGNGGGYLFIKFDVSGNLIWIKQMKICMLLSEKTDEQNNIIVSGGYAGTVYLDNNITLTLPTSQTSSFYMAKFNLNGECVWALTEDGSRWSPLKLNNGYMYANTWFDGIVTLGKSNKQVTFNSANGMSYCAKYDSNGELIWAKQVSSFAVAPDEYGNAYAMEFYSAYPNTGFITKYDSAGNLLWQRTSVYVNDWYKAQMTCGNNGDLFISGGFANYMSIGDTTIYGDNHYHTFVAKLDSAGALKWIITSKGSGSSGAKDITVSGNEIFVTGDMWGENIFGSHTVNLDAGVFTVKITDNDVMAAVPGSVKKNGSTKFTTSNELEVYPNPFTNDFNLKIFLSEKDALEIKIYDVYGKIIYREKIKEFEGELTKKIEIKQPAGVYFVEAEGERNCFTEKIIVNR